ncbi:MAG: sugar ABC transporter permease [Actinomycetia bacterium]|nr:sugar ABC transporter permease [Actinomycetes bacterium]
MAKLISTLVGVAIAVGAFTALWVGANLVFNQARANFTRFSAFIGAIIGGTFITVLDGNRLLTGLVARPGSLFNGDEPGVFTDGIGNALVGHLFWPLVGAVVGAAVSVGLSRLEQRPQRLALSIGAGVAIGLVLSFALKTRYELAMRSTPLIIWIVVGIAVGAGLAYLRKTDLVRGALSGVGIGWILGAFGGAIQGSSLSNQTETTVAFVVAGLLIGARLGMSQPADENTKARIDDRSRGWLFLGPALIFISVTLVIPAFQTLLLSLQEDDSENIVDGFVGLDNYQTVLTDADNFNADQFPDLLTSATEASTSIFPWGGSSLLPWVAFFAIVGVVLAFLLGRETGQRVNFVGAPVLPLLIAAGLFSFALFTHLRGTLINNLWWVLAVTLLSTSLGLTIAKLADGARFESVAKSFVFMPMAISFVGASIIWRLMMYQARDISKNQTGVFNAIWVWLGSQTTSWGAGKVIIGGIFLAAAAALIYAGVKALANSPAAAGLYMAVSLIPLWVGLRTLGDGIGGYSIADDGAIRPLAVNFVQGVPFNNFWLMVILIWIQTGFAMVILSAAIKAVPGDFIEAAKIDGATDGQIFWRITIPQILPTVGVVATTIMVNVMKVFDIVAVTTNGQFGSQVLANAMFEQAFLFSNRGIGAALAVLLFVGIFPIMVLNIYRLTKEA